MSSKSAKDPDSSEPIVHEYDGILEADNQLPRWWLVTLFGTVVFAAGYWQYFHSHGRGEFPSKEYARIKAAEAAAEAERLKEFGEVTPEMLLTLSKDPATIEQGKAVFEQICVTCHAAGGKGDIGPNLTDKAWIHDPGPVSIYTIVRNGSPNQQMSPWGKTLGEAKTRSVAAYALTLKNTNAPGGKAPQGDKSE